MPFNAKIRDPLNNAMQTFKKDMGYFAVQSTKPQTIGYSLADSPVGLLAWIYEKLVKISDAYPWTDDEGLHFYRHRLRAVANRSTQTCDSS